MNDFKFNIAGQPYDTFKLRDLKQSDKVQFDQLKLQAKQELVEAWANDAYQRHMWSRDHGSEDIDSAAFKDEMFLRNQDAKIDFVFGNVDGISVPYERDKFESETREARHTALEKLFDD